MGKSSISYKVNAIDFKKARKHYYAPASEASSMGLFNVFCRPKFKQVDDIEEFDNGEYIYRFASGEWFKVKAVT